MRRAALLALPLALGGCSGMGKYVHDTMLWSGSNPNGPGGDSETIRRVRGEKVAVLPITADSGNIWPGTPQPLPTLKDVENPNSVFNRALGDPETYFGGAALDKTFNDGFMNTGSSMKSGESISAGESTDASHGVSEDHSHVMRGLPVSVPDSAGKFLSKNPDRTITIPNGDGTNTLIAPDGTVRVIRSAPSPSPKK